MNLKDIEGLFQRSWYAFDKKRLILVFFTLCVCGVFAVFSRVIGVQANAWVRLSLAFMPLFASTTLLFALGIILTKITQNENLGQKKNFFQLLMQSMRSFNSILYLTLPLFFTYLLSWLILGVFFVLKSIPGLGDFVSIFLSFGPFILIFGSLALAFLNVAFLFFLTPLLALRETLTLKILKETLQLYKKNLLVSTCILALAALPIFFILCFLISAAYLTKMSYFDLSTPLFVGLQWFFLMLPFNALLSPFILFFFNFSSHFYLHLQDEPIKDKLVKKTSYSL